MVMVMVVVIVYHANINRNRNYLFAVGPSCLNSEGPANKNIAACSFPHHKVVSLLKSAHECVGASLLRFLFSDALLLAAMIIIVVIGPSNG